MGIADHVLPLGDWFSLFVAQTKIVNGFSERNFHHHQSTMIVGDSQDYAQPQTTSD